MKKASFSGLTVDELVVKRAEFSAKLRGMRFDGVLGRLESPIDKRVLRREIARLNTLIRAHELGHKREEG